MTTEGNLVRTEPTLHHFCNIFNKLWQH